MKNIPLEAIILCETHAEANIIGRAAVEQYPKLKKDFPENFEASYLKSYKSSLSEKSTIYIDTPGTVHRGGISYNWGHVTRGFDGPIVRARDLLMAQDLTSSSPSAPDPPSILLEFPQIRNVE